MPEDTTALIPAMSAEIVEQVIIGGDLAKLTPTQRVAYYRNVCDSLGLNYLTKPFEYIVLNNRLTLYARKEATDQLRDKRKVSLTIVKIVEDRGAYIVTARATMPDGRTDESTGVVDLGKLQGDARANIMMKAETKAKRRVTLSIVGLGWLDEQEVETIPNAPRVTVDMSTGEITGSQADDARWESMKSATPGAPPGTGKPAAAPVAHSAAPVPEKAASTPVAQIASHVTPILGTPGVKPTDAERLEFGKLMGSHESADQIRIAARFALRCGNPMNQGQMQWAIARLLEWKETGVPKW